ncbi:hypothetical protein Cgig2_008440 [Carnegiea gigantea]|uniref:Uncharacterized protein n=1 Tax=Carnegiea gigantea TaxID=171969 RepID=A0A9Q1GIL8_9CARY|nr:hypothetical protein Cgig2_006415 [Carnegiea gigantea]KAJ8423199.1 hypothetical protein Cgig2_008440 [Carnegiea gigantea]
MTEMLGPSQCSRRVSKSSTDTKREQRLLCSFIHLQFHLTNQMVKADTLVSDASIIVEKEEHYEDVVLDQPKSITKEDRSMPSYSICLGLSQPDSQSPVPQNTFVPNPSIAAVNEDDGIEDGNAGAPLRFTLRNTSQLRKKPKEGDEPASKKGETTGSKVPSPHNAKEPAGQSKQALSLEVERKQPQLEKAEPLDPVKKRQPQNLPLAYCSPYMIQLTKLDSELSQDELTISEYVFSKVEDVDDSEHLFDGCGNKEAIRASMVTLRPREQLEVNAINIWSNILND